MLTSLFDGQRSGRERGQALVVAVFVILLLLVIAAFLLDLGFFLRARRDAQNTSDAAALAGAQHLPDDPATAELAAQEWAAFNGWADGQDGVTVDVSVPYDGTFKKIEVTVAGPAKGARFFSAFFNVNARAVAEVIITGSGGGTGGGIDEDGDGEIDGNLVQVPGLVAGCGGDDAFVDGRITGNEDYKKFANLVGDNGVLYGEAYFACGDGYFYFALRLNALNDGGVANENVYGEGSRTSGYHADYQTGWNRHTFGMLEGSDRARFRTACNEPLTTVHDFEQDYLYWDGSTWRSDTDGPDEGAVYTIGPDSSSSSLAFNLNNPDVTGWSDGTTQSPPFDSTYPDYDEDLYGGWEWEMIYEFRVAQSHYEGCNSIFFGLWEFDGDTDGIIGIHNSPAKEEGGENVVIASGDSEIVLVE